MRGRFFVICLFAVLFCALKPAQAHEHCTLDGKHHDHAVRHEAEIPDPHSKASIRDQHQHTMVCVFLPKMPAKHCDMADCYLKCGATASQSGANVSGGQEFAQQTAQVNFDAFFQIRFQAPIQESAVYISTNPDPRPPSA